MPAKGKAKGAKGKGKAGKGKKKGKSKAQIAALVVATKLESLELIRADGATETLLPRFRADTYFYANSLPFDMGLHELTVRVTAREHESTVLVEEWTQPADPPAGAAAAPPARSGSAKKGKGKEAKGKEAKGKAPAAKAKQAKDAKGKGKGEEPAPPLGGLPAHLEPWAGFQLQPEPAEPPAPPEPPAAAVPTPEGAPAPEGGGEARAAPEMPPEAQALALQPATLVAVRAAAPRIYDAFRPAPPLGSGALVSHRAFYETVHGLGLGVGMREIDELFAMAAAAPVEGAAAAGGAGGAGRAGRAGGAAGGGGRSGGGEVSFAQLGAMLRRCKPSCAEEAVRFGPDATPRDDGFFDPQPTAAAPAVAAAAAPTAAAPAAAGSAAGAEGAPPHADGAPGGPPERRALPPSPSKLFRVTVTSADLAAQCHYFLELRCEPPPAPPELPEDLREQVGRLFDYCASAHAERPRTAAAPGGGAARAGAGAPADAPAERRVGLAGFVSALLSAHVCACAADARAGFMRAHRNRPRSLAGPRAFWASLFFAFVRAGAAEGTWEHSPEAVLGEIRMALLMLAWNRGACAVAARNRTALEGRRSAQERGRMDQGRAWLQGDRWVFAPAEGAGAAQEAADHAASGRDGAQLELEPFGPLDELRALVGGQRAPPPAAAAKGGKGAAAAAAAAAAAVAAASEKRQAYLGHMREVWAAQQGAAAWAWPS